LRGELLRWKGRSPRRLFAAQLLAEQLVGVLPDFLGHPVPAEAVEIVKGAILSSMAICDDYKAEIDSTIEFVDKNLRDHGIIY